MRNYEKSIMKIVRILIMAALVCLIGNCSGKSKSEARNIRAQNAKGDILIGSAGAWEKARKEKSDSLEKGIRLAVDTINSSGGVLGREITVIWKDDNAEATKAKIVAKELADNPDLIAVIGHMNSDTAVSASIIYQAFGVVMITPCATVPELTNRSGFSLIFRGVPSDTYFAEMLMNYIANNGFKYTPFIRNIVIYNVNNLYGNGLASEYENQADLYRINVVSRRVFESGCSSLFLKNDFNHIKSLYDFDAVLIAGQTEDSVKIISEIKRQDPKIQIFCSEGISSALLKKKLGEDSSDIMYCSTYNPDNPAEESKKLNETYLKRYGELPDQVIATKFKDDYLKRYGELPDHLAAQGYDAVYALVNAIKMAGTTAPESIAETLRSSNYRGVTGDISFKKNGDLKKNNVILKKITYQKEIEGK